MLLLSLPLVHFKFILNWVKEMQSQIQDKAAKAS